MDNVVQVTQTIWRTLNSNFAVAFIGGLTGAIGGALGAQYIAERVRGRAELVRELRNTNAAIIVSSNISNVALALKKQHVKPWRDRFTADKDTCKVFRDKLNNGEIAADELLEFTADLKTFPGIVVPIETIKDLVFEKISAHGRALALVSVLEQSVVGLNDAIKKRDEMVQKFADRTIPERLLPAYYFGMSLPNGHTDRVYPDLVEAISSYLDDVIFFSALLCEDLVKHGMALKRRLTAKWRGNALEVSTVNFSRAKNMGLVPSEDNYRSWLNGFVEYGAKADDSAERA